MKVYKVKFSSVEPLVITEELYLTILDAKTTGRHVNVTITSEYRGATHSFTMNTETIYWIDSYEEPEVDDPFSNIKIGI